MMRKWGVVLAGVGGCALALLLWAVGTSAPVIGGGWAIAVALVALVAGITLVVAARDA